MKYRTLGRTGLVVSEICFGTMTFGGDGFWRVVGAQDQQAADGLVRRAFDAGVNFFDTADVYANGLSERILGEAVRRNGAAARRGGHRDEGPREGVDLLPPEATDAQRAEADRRGRAKNVNGLSRKHILDGIDASLARLGMDHVDLYQIHGYDPLTPLEEVVEALDAVVRAGKARYVGLCNRAAWETAKALGISERRGLARFASMQMYYTLAGRDLEREVVPMAQSEGLAILAVEPPRGGLLSGKFRRDAAGPEGSRRATFDFPPVDRARAFDCIDAMTPMAESRGVSVARIALAWLLHRPWVTSVIIGAKTEAQLVDNLASVSVVLSDEELATLDGVSALPPEYPGWMIERQGSDRAAQVAPRR